MLVPSQSRLSTRKLTTVKSSSRSGEGGWEDSGWDNAAEGWSKDTDNDDGWGDTDWGSDMKMTSGNFQITIPQFVIHQNASSKCPFLCLYRFLKRLLQDFNSISQKCTFDIKFVFICRTK